MTVLKLNDIEKLYSEKVAEYINKGYSISVEHSKGSQTNEISTICLTNDNGKTVLRVGLIRACKDWRKEELKLVVLKYENVGYRTLWISEGEVLEERTFIEVEDKKTYCESEEDFKAILSKRKERSRKYYDDDEVEVTSPKIQDMIWRIVRKKDGYKGIPKKRIQKIIKVKNGYLVRVENKYSVRINLVKE